MITCTCSLIASPLEPNRTRPIHQDVVEAPPAGAGPPAGLEGRRWRAVAGYSWVTPGHDAAYPFRQMRDGGKTARQEPAAGKAGGPQAATGYR